MTGYRASGIDPTDLLEPVVVPSDLGLSGPPSTMQHMERAGIRELEQNASAVVVAAAASGQTVIITDRGRPVAQLTPLEESPLNRLRAARRLQEPRTRLADLPAPASPSAPVPSLSETLAAMREDDRS